jgi:hypothetical protein
MARNNQASSIALGGVMAALAVVILCLTVIPVATFICPTLCMMLLRFVSQKCGKRIGWAWYGAVAILGVLLAPDKEAAAVFVFLGYYPLIKPALDRWKPNWLWKGLYFNIAIAILYTLLLKVLGMDELAEDYAELGMILTVVMLIMGNITFFLLDRLLGMRFRKRSR